MNKYSLYILEDRFLFSFYLIALCGFDDCYMTIYCLGLYDYMYLYTWMCLKYFFVLQLLHKLNDLTCKWVRTVLVISLQYVWVFVSLVNLFYLLNGFSGKWCSLWAVQFLALSVFRPHDNTFFSHHFIIYVHEQYIFKKYSKRACIVMTFK